ncbi:DUF7694 domain-containing protein [Anaerovorax sp. IOR16]|uniref:DUF7694 domain-containing protein n=1 Tax=Anaerovorax sp. IOR16 TaxID=2773458 RepID=UPI0019D12D15|nr:hypothetical protein [Anaerovorax sp. IOR16]
MKSISEIKANPRIKIMEIGLDGGYAIVNHLSPKAKPIMAVFSWGDGWDHVSVSYPNRCLTWDEMCYIKDCFFEEEECVVQFHPKKSEYINIHPYCLHLWKPHNGDFTTPPKGMV